eukprot:Sspe_Gene.33452::Locus_16330_Transcript_1_1_Confidence_1.000_Length_433::g.33452::m.33452
MATGRSGQRRWGQAAVHAAVGAMLAVWIGGIGWLLWRGSLVAGAGLLAALGTGPVWLPGRVVALRMMLLTRINDGQGASGEGYQVPSKEIPIEEFRRLYREKAA